jgi:protocatechuate 3,4-dioxygenase beta subunit
MIRGTVLAVMLGLGAFPVDGQQAPRDNASVASVRVGTASVSGIVTLGDRAQTPVRRAVVTMLSTDGLDNRSAVSDDEGRFTIGGLPSGRYILQARKPAHLTMAYGARGPGRLGTSLVLEDGQAVRDLRLALPRGAVLTGTLTLENGEPLTNTQLLAIPRRVATAGGITPPPSHVFRTDDRGEFRIYGLLPDTYLLAAIPAFGGEMERRREDDFDTIVRALQQSVTAKAGQTAVSHANLFPAGVKVGYAPTYFPGTPIVGEATPIDVQAGEVRNGLDFAISRLPLATISGTVIGLNGEPIQAARVSVEPEGPPLPRDGSGAGPLPPRVAVPNARGEFSITGVAPGRYRIHAHAAGTIARDSQSLAQTAWARADVSLIGIDVTGLTLALQAGRLFSGTLSTGSAPAPPSWSGAIVILQAAGGNASLALNGLTSGTAIRQAPVASDGRFTVTGLVPADYEVRVTLPPGLAAGGWKVGSIRQRGRELRDAPLTFADGSIESVEITLTTDVTELAGRVTSASGAPAADFFLLAFPEDRALWHPASPRIRVVRPAVDGAFSIRDLPAGAYRLAALADVEDDGPKRREFLESIYDTGLRVDVETGKRTEQQLILK